LEDVQVYIDAAGASSQVLTARVVAVTVATLCVLFALALLASGAAFAQDVVKFPLKPLLQDLAVTHERIQAAQAGF
jgi:hypothetical protein